MNKNVNESDFEWTDSIDANLTVGNQYYVKSHNGVYWSPIEYCGRGRSTVSGNDMDGHKFKDIGRSSCNEWWSDESMKNKIENGFIKDYDPDWSIMDEVQFGSLKDIKGRNFVIYFEGSVGIDDTIPLQEKLLSMGFSFPNNGGKVITSKDTKNPILMFECYNWDNTNDRYKSMPNDYRDKGLMLLVDYKEPDRWSSKDPDRLQQETFSTVVDHNAIVIDGHQLLTKKINESDFEWTETVSSDPLQWVGPDRPLDGDEISDGLGEIWVDIGGYDSDERINIFHNIEKHLGQELNIQIGGIDDTRNGRISDCLTNNSLLLHCGHAEYNYFSQQNHVCCMGNTYEKFMAYEQKENPNTVVRPRVNGGIFLEKENLTEGFYYKGVNPTVDLIVIRGDKVLLIQRGDDAEAEPGKWALPGGFHDTNAKEGEEWREDKESSLDAAKREVKEETGLDVDSIKGLIFQMVGVFEGGGRDPRDKEDAWTRSTVYMVRIPEEEGQEVKGMDDAQRAEWVHIDKVLQHKLAFDHHKIIEKALSMNMNEAKEILKTLLTESNEFDWVKDVEFKLDDEFIKNLMSNCEDIPITNYNMSTKLPYSRRGKMNVMYYSMCPFWWDKLKDEPQDEDGRGKGEWFQSGWNTPETSVAVIMPNRNGVSNLRDMDNDDFSAITYDLKGISRNFNGGGSELWILLDNDGNLRYDLIPPHLVDEVRQGFEGVEMSRSLEESNEFDWVNDAPDLDEHRFFEIYVCYNSFYDEETGEDECVEGGSYHLKIPREVVPQLWDYEAEDGYIAGPGDEGMEIIQWCMDNGYVNGDNFDDVEYVTELGRSEYCLAWGNYQTEDRGLCHKSINESEFDWIEETPQANEFVLGRKYFIDFTIDESDEGSMSYKGAKLRGEVLNMAGSLGFDVKSINATNVDFLYLNEKKYRSGLYIAHWDRARNNEEFEEIYDYVNEYGFTILTPSDFLRMGGFFLSEK